MWKYQYTKQKVELTDKLKKALYEESQGITDFAVKLFYFAQKRAIESEIEKITVGIIRSVAKEKLNMPRKILNALKTGNMEVLREFEDVYPRNFENNFIVASSQDAESNGFTDTSSQIDNGESANISIELKPFSKPNDKPLKNTSSKTREYGLSPNKLTGLSAEKKQMILKQLISQSNKNEPLIAYKILKDSGFMRSSDEFYLY